MEPHNGLNNLDYVVLGIVLLSGLLALMRGFVRELFSLIAWVGAYFSAVKFYPLAVPFVHHYIKTDKGAEWGAMAAVFAGALILLMIIGAITCSFIKGRGLTLIDRSLGFVYGLARGAAVVSLVYLATSMVIWPDIDKPKTEQQDKDRNIPPTLLVEARTRPIMTQGALLLKRFVPEKILDKTLKDSEDAAAHVSKESRAEVTSQAQKVLDMLSTPAPQPAAGDDANQSNLNPTLNQVNKP